MAYDSPAPGQWEYYWSQVGEDRLHQILLNSVSQAVIATDLQGQVRFWNRAAELLYGWPEQEAIGKSILDLTPTAASQAHALSLMHGLKQGQTWSGEFQVRHRHGREFSVFVTNAPIFDDAGNFIGLIGVSADITAHKATQSELRLQHEQAQTLTRVVDAIHQSLDLDTIFSVSAAHIAQLLQAEVSIVEYVPERQLWVHRTVYNAHQEPIAKVNEEIPDAHNPIAERLKRLEVVEISDTRNLDDPINTRLAEIDPGSWLLTPISINGRVWGSLTLGRLHRYAAWSEADIDLAQRVAAQLGIAIDQAETYRRLQQELAQRRANEIRLRQYERIVSATHDGIALLDRNYIYRVVNQVYLDWNQKSRDEIVGHSVADLLGADAFHRQIKPSLDRCFGGEVVQYQDWFTYGNQQRRYVLVTYAPYSDQTGQITGVVVTTRDITDLELAQNALLQQAKQERAINNVVRLIRQSLDMDAIFARAVEAICPLLEADHGAVAKFEEPERVWVHIAEYRRNSTSPSCLGLRLPDDNNPVATSLKQGLVVRLDHGNDARDEMHRQLMQTFPGTWLIVPLRINQHAWGSLTLRKLEPGWTDESVHLVTRIADQLAMGIHQAELYQAAQAELQKRQRTEAALKEQESFFRSLYEQATLGIAFCQVDGTILQANAKYCAITGYSEAELQTMSLKHLTHPDDQPSHQTTFHQVARGQRSDFSTELRYLLRDGTMVWVNMTVSVICDERGQCTVLAVIIQDISDRKQLEAERHQAEAQLRHNALHDSLTQLPNRNLLMAHLERALKRLQRPPHHSFAVVFLDIDRFKLVNDSLGHLVGDQLLITVAQTLAQLVRPADLVARLGGDEFVILLDVVEDLSAVLIVADRILHALRQPFVIEQREVYATASMGIVMGTQAYGSATELLRDADIAMYRAKANGKNGYALFDPTLHDRVMTQLQLEYDLRRAIDQQQLALYYQPIVSLKDGSIAYVEALMRWHHPDRGMISPGEFIPIAEETGLIVALDRWALTTACRQLQQWHQRFPLGQNLRVSVNLSAQDLHAPDLIGDIRTALNESGLEGRFLVIEMTESLLISDTQPVIQLIAQLQELAVQLSVDDFGTGYSSLSYLHRFPLNALKIDQSFTSNMSQGPVNREIIETIVALTDRLGITAIAEGGETPEQIAHLKQIGCEYSQGYHFCKPIPAAELEPLLQQPCPFAHKLPPNHGT
jgi:diguanylate cyclase (GGDEF)-like protein/PAS domain S-box-containing protein